ncbi:hypothetical protein QCA50_007337 [Cerrena zonata]|uniref:Uncharacterized protein n=1 Tax=Cerrena zonata TaxID=2478898 RepID=A0AAW0GKB1_9APHY
MFQSLSSIAESGMTLQEWSKAVPLTTSQPDNDSISELEPSEKEDKVWDDDDIEDNDSKDNDNTEDTDTQDIQGNENVLDDQALAPHDYASSGYDHWV